MTAGPRAARFQHRIWKRCKDVLFTPHCRRRCHSVSSGLEVKNLLQMSQVLANGCTTPFRPASALSR